MGITKVLHGKDRVSIFPVTIAIMGHDMAQVICAPEPDSIDVRLESGDIVEIIEGDVYVVPKVEGVPDGSFR